MRNKFCVGIGVTRLNEWSNPAFSGQNARWAEALIQPLAQEHGDLTVITFGCDRGLPRALRDHCNEKGIGFVEARTIVAGTLEREALAEVWEARHQILFTLAQEIIAVVTPDRKSALMENFIRDTKQRRIPHTIYAVSGGALNVIGYETAA